MTTTALLQQVRAGDHKAESLLMGRLYDELRKVARGRMGRERPDHTLQPTALVNEVYLRLFNGAPVPWQDRAHFFAVAAGQMHRVLVDHARHAQSKKAGGGAKVQLDVRDGAQIPQFELVLVKELLEQLAGTDPQAARVVECKIYSGMTDKATASAIGIPIPKVREAWAFARAWLADRLR